VLHSEHKQHGHPFRQEPKGGVELKLNQLVQPNQLNHIKPYMCIKSCDMSTKTPHMTIECLLSLRRRRGRRADKEKIAMRRLDQDQVT
jgi:hypothetical protein